MSAPAYRSIIIDPDQTSWRVLSVRKWRGPTSDHSASFADAEDVVTLDGTSCSAIITEHDDLTSRSVGTMPAAGSGRYATIHVLADGTGYSCSCSADERGAW